MRQCCFVLQHVLQVRFFGACGVGQVLVRVLLAVVPRDVPSRSVDVQGSTKVALEIPCIPRIVVLDVLVLIHLAHVLHHSVSVLLVGTDQRADTLGVNIWIWLYVVYLAQVVLWARHGVHRPVIHELRRTVHSLLDAAVLMAVIRRKPLVLSRDGALWLVIEVASLFLFLEVHVLVGKIAKQRFLHLVLVQLLRSRIRLGEVADLFVVRNDNSFGLELWRAFHGDALVELPLNFQFLIWINLCVRLRLNVCFVVDGVPEVADLVRWLQMVWHRHLCLNRLLVLDAVDRVDFLVLLMVYVVECFGVWWFHSLITHLLQRTLF